MQYLQTRLEKFDWLTNLNLRPVMTKRQSVTETGTFYELASLIRADLAQTAAAFSGRNIHHLISIIESHLN